MEIILDRFEYKIPEGMYVVHKESIGFKYKLKHHNVEFYSEDEILKYIDKALEDRKRFIQLQDTLIPKELGKIFDNIELLKLQPRHIKEYEVVEQFEYVLVVDEDWDNSTAYETLWELKDGVADKLGLCFHGDYDLCSNSEVVVDSY